MPVQITVQPKQVFRISCAIIVLLVMMSTLMITALYFHRWQEGSPMFNVVKFFWLDTEANLPTFYQALNLLLSAFLLAIIAINAAKNGERFSFHWKLLAILFLCLGIDEASHVHEVAQTIFSQLLRENHWVHDHVPSRILFFVPGVLAVIFIIITYMRFILYLPKRTRWQFILSGAMFIGGALCVEMASQSYAYVHGKGTPIYGGLSTLEEFMEMMGIAIFIFALLEYLSRQANSFQILIHGQSKNSRGDEKGAS